MGSDKHPSTFLSAAKAASNVISLTSKRRECIARKSYHLAKSSAPIGSGGSVCHIGANETATNAPLPLPMTIETPSELISFLPEVAPRNGLGPESRRRLADVGGSGVSAAQRAPALGGRIVGEDVSESFGKRFKEARKDSRTKFSEIEAIVGTKRQSLARWDSLEHFPRGLSETRFLALVERFGVRYEWLKYGTGPMRDPAPGKPSYAIPSIAAPAAAESPTSDNALRRLVRDVAREAKDRQREIEDKQRELEALIRRLEDLSDT